MYLDASAMKNYKYVSLKRSEKAFNVFFYYSHDGCRPANTHTHTSQIDSVCGIPQLLWNI